MKQLKRFNKIIKRIAAYYDSQSNVVNTIPQTDSEKAFDDNNYQALIFMNSLLDGNKNDIISNFEYESTGIAPYGDSFIGKDGNNYVVEWQIYQITSLSEDNAYDALDKLCVKNSMTQDEEKELREILESHMYNHFFMGAILIFQNGNLYDQLKEPQLDANYFFNQDTNKNTIKEFGKNLIEQIKQSLT